MSPTPTPSPPDRDALLRHVRPADLRAVLSLAAQAANGVIDITESVHQSVRDRLGLAAGAQPDRTGGLTGHVYRGIRGVTQLVGHGVDGALAALLPLVDDPARHPEASAGREAVLAALNGVLGDRLLATHNPLAQAMVLRYRGRNLSLERGPDLQQQLAQATPHLLVLVHGLCMNDTQWRHNGHDHGDVLALALGATPVYLRYNSGLHISTNGRDFARQLDALAARWPVPSSATAWAGWWRVRPARSGSVPATAGAPA